MKSIITTSLVFLSMTAFADNAVLIKQCLVHVPTESEELAIDMNIEMYQNKDQSVLAKITQTEAGHTSTSEIAAAIVEGPVRANLSADSAVEELSQVELLIVHAMMVTTDPDIELLYSAGLDLQKVRSAKIYGVLGEQDDIGSLSVVEAKDENGNDLGSFLGGFIVSPCK